MDLDRTSAAYLVATAVVALTIAAVAPTASAAHDSGGIHVEASDDNVDADGNTSVAETDDGDAVYGSVQAGVDNADFDSTVTVANGTYTEAVSVNVKELTLTSQDSVPTPTIEADSTVASNDDPTLAVLAPGVSVDGFNLFRNVTEPPMTDATTEVVAASQVGITLADLEISFNDPNGADADNAALRASNPIFRGYALPLNVTATGLDISADATGVAVQADGPNTLSALDLSGSSVAGADTGLAVSGEAENTTLSVIGNEFSANGVHVDDAPDAVNLTRTLANNTVDKGAIATKSDATVHLEDLQKFWSSPQDAIDASSSALDAGFNATVTVAPASYANTLANFPEAPQGHKGDFTLRTAGELGTTSLEAGFSVASANVTVDGFVVRADSSVQGAEDVSVASNGFIDSALTVSSSPRAAIEDNTFQGGSGTGLSISDSDDATVRSNDFLFLDVGASLTDTQGATVADNSFSGLSDGLDLVTDAEAVSADVRGNSFDDLDEGVSVASTDSDLNDGAVVLRGNSFETGKVALDAADQATGEPVDAAHNWWDSPAGPTDSSSAIPAMVTGDTVKGEVVYQPWCLDQFCLQVFAQETALSAT